MQSIHPLIPNHTTLLELEPEELAGIVLEYFNSRGSKGKRLIGYGNFISGEALRDYPHEYENDIRYALVEALVWLENEGLIAQDPIQKSKDWYFITRRGRKLEDRTAVEAYRKARLLPIEIRQEYEYDVTLSFAGEDRQYAEALARLLDDGGYSVFYDNDKRTLLWGENLYDYFFAVYKEKARYCVIFASEHYVRKLWTNHERKSAQARAFEESGTYILPVKLDDKEIPGIPSTVGYLDLHSMSIEEIYQALVEKLSDSPSQRPTTLSNSPVVEEDRGEFLLLGSEDEKMYFFPLQEVHRDSTEMSLELLPESPEDAAFLGTLQDQLSNQFASRPTLICAYQEYASWVTPQNILETSSHWKVLLNPDSRGQNHDFFSEATVNGISPDEIAKMRARRILLDEKLEDADPTSSQSNVFDQAMLEVYIRGMATSSHEPKLQVNASPLPQLYRQFGQTPERFKKFARLISILHLKLTNTVENVLQLDLELLGPTQLQVKFKGTRPKFYSNEDPKVLEFEGICSLSK